MRNLLPLSIALLLFSNSFETNAQAPIFEKTYETGRKKNPDRFTETFDITINKEKEVIDMTYVFPLSAHRASELSISPPKIKYENYTFDKNLELVTKGVAPAEGQEPSYTTIRCSHAFTGTGQDFTGTEEALRFPASEGSNGLPFYKLKKTYKWVKNKNFKGGGYTGIVTEGVKQVSKDGYESYDGAVLQYEADRSIVCMARKSKMEIPTFLKKYYVLHSDQDLNITVSDSLLFQYKNMLFYSGQLKDKQNPSEVSHDWVVLYAPIKDWKNTGDPVRTNFTYLRINSQGKIIEKISFESPANFWNVEGAYEQDGSVYLYGFSLIKDPVKNYSGDVLGSKGREELTYSNFQIAKVTKGKFDFISSTLLKDIEPKKVKPADQKKFLNQDGTGIQAADISIANSGDILVTCQDYEFQPGSTTNDPGIGNPKLIRNFNGKGVSLYQFDATGNFKRSYEVQINAEPKQVRPGGTDGAWERPSGSSFFPSGDGKTLYWVIRSVKDAALISTVTPLCAGFGHINGIPMYGIDYGSINLETGDISSFKTFSEDKKMPFYLYNNTGAYQMGNNIYFFSETEQGDKMKITRIDISK